MIKLTLPMPRLGETMDSGTIAGWNVAEGDSFERGDTLLELETDKTLVEYPALESGRLIETLVAEGDVVDVGDPIAIIESEKTWPTGGMQDEDASQPKPDLPRDSARPEHSAPIRTRSRLKCRLVMAFAPPSGTAYRKTGRRRPEDTDRYRAASPHRGYGCDCHT